MFMAKAGSGMSTRLKIAQVCWQFGGHQEGISRAVTELSVRLAQEHEVHVFAHGFSGREGSTLRFRKVAVPPRLGWLWALGFSMSSAMMLRKECFDIVHVHVPCLHHSNIVTCHIFPRVMGRWAKSLNREARTWMTPSQKLRLAVFALHEPLYRYNFRRRHNRRFVAVSSKVKRELMTEYGFAEPEVTVVPLGVDLKEFTPTNRSRAGRSIRKTYDIPEDAFMFVFVGQNFVGKGLQFILDVFAALKRRCHLLVVGSGEGTEGYIFEQVKRLKLQDRVTFAGSQADIAPFYAASDAYVTFSPYESFGLSVLEAMASGLPVIGSCDVGFLQDLKMDPLSRSAAMVSSQQALREAMEHMAEDREQSREWGRGARCLAERYTWERHSNQMDQIYAAVAGCDHAIMGSE